MGEEGGFSDKVSVNKHSDERANDNYDIRYIYIRVEEKGESADIVISNEIAGCAGG